MNVSFVLNISTHFLIIAILVVSIYFEDVNVEKDTVTCEIPFGGLLLFSNILPHRRLDYSIIIFVAALLH